MLNTRRAPAIDLYLLRELSNEKRSAHLVIPLSLGISIAFTPVVSYIAMPRVLTWGRLLAALANMIQLLLVSRQVVDWYRRRRLGQLKCLEAEWLI